MGGLDDGVKIGGGGRKGVEKGKGRGGKTGERGGQEREREMERRRKLSSHDGRGISVANVRVSMFGERE